LGGLVEGERPRKQLRIFLSILLTTSVPYTMEV
jgi:hypothetical protein